MPLPNRLAPDDYFLSPTNPLATTDQRDSEALAVRLMKHPSVSAGLKAAEHRWRSLVGTVPDPEAWGRFDAYLEECAFAAAMKAINGDANYPKVVRIVMPPHHWFGADVPGSRFGGGPGMDQSYAIVPVDYGTRFEISGRWLDPAPADHVYTLVGNPSFTNVLAQLERSQLQVDPDGKFTITVGPDLSEEGCNYIQTKPGAQYLFIRDCRSDWRQTATALRVKRIDPPARSPWTEFQIAEKAAQIMLEDCPAMYAWRRYFEWLEVNTISQPFGTGNLGGLTSQTISFARIKLTADEAYVITVEPAGASFHDIQLNDFWFNSVGDYVAHTSSFNNAQSARCADGRIVYVICKNDPGLHNWLDPVGLHEVLLVHRWQRLPRSHGEHPRPAISGRTVSFTALHASLSQDVRTVDAAERHSQLQDRLMTYRQRLMDR